MNDINAVWIIIFLSIINVMITFKLRKNQKSIFLVWKVGVTECDILNASNIINVVVPTLLFHLKH